MDADQEATPDEKTGVGPYDKDPTQGRTIGSDPREDPTQGGKSARSRARTQQRDGNYERLTVLGPGAVRRSPSEAARGKPACLTQARRVEWPAP